MVESKLRVEVTRFDNANSHYYGNVIEKKVVEDVRLCEFDKRNKTCIAPCGINATIAIDKSYKDLDGNKIDAKEIFDIKISRYYLEHEGDDGFLAFFNVEDKVYELWVKFNESNEVENLWLSEWLEYGYYQSGDDADNIYEMNEFTSYETFEQ
jgi:hypothetical protein